MSNDITTLAAKLKAAAKEEIMCREACDTSDLWQDEASPENVLALVEALENYKAAYEEEARDKEVQRSVTDNALCKLLPGCQYMDPPDGGNVTPLEQVSRMVEDYRQRIAELEARTLTVKLPSLNPEMFNEDVIFGYRKAQKEAFHFCAAAGIKLQIEGE